MSYVFHPGKISSDQCLITDNTKILKTAIYEDLFCARLMLHKDIKHIKQAKYLLHSSSGQLEFFLLKSKLRQICSRKSSLTYHVQVKCLLSATLSMSITACIKPFGFACTSRLATNLFVLFIVSLQSLTCHLALGKGSKNTCWWMHK